MLRKMILVTVLVSSTLVMTPAQAAADPVVEFAVGYIGGHIIDWVYGSVTDKPDVRELDRRLKLLEDNAAMRSEMRKEIRRVRSEPQ